MFKKLVQLLATATAILERRVLVYGGIIIIDYYIGLNLRFGCLVIWRRFDSAATPEAAA